MTKILDDKHFDQRTIERYLKKGLISKADVSQFLENLPNDEDNFELTTFEEEEQSLDSEFLLSEDEIANMPPISEDEINNFDFMEKSTEDTSTKPEDNS